MAQETIVLVNELSDRFITAEDSINNNFTEVYAGIAGGVPTSRTIEINGVSQDLSSNRVYTVTDANLSTSDITTNNSDTTKHGFLKKLSNVATEYMDGTGNWSTPPGGSGTNLAIGTVTGTTVQITSDTGTDATIPAATITDAGLLIATDKVKLNNTTNTNSGDNAANTTSNTYADGKVSDAAYGVGWNGDTTVAPSKNAVYDKINSMGNGDVVGPASATASGVALFDGTSGKLIKDSGLTLSGTNTGDQTSVSGNAGTATTLQTARKINKVSFDGGADIITEQSQSLITDLGSAIIASPLGKSPIDVTSAFTLGNQSLRVAAIEILKDMTITGVKWYQNIKGDYTANNYNGVGLYSYSGGTLTLVASSTDDGNIWKAAANAWTSKVFSATYSATAGIYYVAALYCRSAVVTAPSIGVLPGFVAASSGGVDFANSAKLVGTYASQTSLTTPVNMSSFSNNTPPLGLFLY